VSPGALQAGTVFGTRDLERVVDMKLEEHKEKQVYEQHKR
jgi:hypothetical protein